MNNLFILSGKIKSGKTTRLFEWCKNRNDADGILSPIINGKRFLHHIKSGEKKLLESDENTSEENHIKIGRFIFNNKTFLWGKEKLLNAINEEPSWLIVDEVGPLELNDKGFEPIISNIFFDKKASKKSNILIVVREGLLNSFIEKYKLQPENLQIFNFD